MGMKTLPKTFWFGVACGLALVALIAAVPALTDFNTTQFDTSNNKVALKSGVRMTNAYSANSFTANYAEFTNNVQIDGSLTIPTGATNGFVFTTDGSGTGSWRPGGVGDTTGTNIVTLTQTGTNVSAMDFSLVQNGGLFKLSLTNNAFIPTPSNVATSPFRHCWLAVQQPSTGTCLVTWTNGSFSSPEANALINDTNNGAVVYYELVTDPFTNGLVQVWMSTKMQRLP